MASADARARPLHRRNGQAGGLRGLGKLPVAGVKTADAWHEE